MWSKTFNYGIRKIEKLKKREKKGIEKRKKQKNRLISKPQRN